jgi:hypothetical protein
MAQNYDVYEKLIHLVKLYFFILGYPEQNFEYEFKTSIGQIDLLIRDNNFDPYIVVEIKSHFSEKMSPLDSSVRQAHLYSTEIKAPYFVITNGIEFYWFETGLTGRPNQLEPIQFKYDKDKKFIDKENEFALSSIRKLRNISMHSQHASGNPSPTEAVFFLLVKLIAERENQGQINEEIISSIQNKLPLLEDIRIDGLWKAADILRGVNFSNIPKYQLLDNIEQIFLIDKQYMGQFDLPKWLSTFMVRLSELRSGDSILNLNVGLGRIIASISIEAQGLEEITITGQAMNQSLALWSLLPICLFTNSLPNITWESSSTQSNFYSKVLCAPPFGGKISPQRKDLHFQNGIFSDIQVTNDETNYLVSSIESANEGGEIVFLVSQGFLYREGAEKRVRKAILTGTTLKAIIGLPSNALAPYTGIKTSILVIEKKPPKNSTSVFIANLDEIQRTSEFTIPPDSQVQLVLDVYKENSLFKDHSTLFRNVTYEEIEHNDFDFTPARYTKEFVSIPEEFELLSLKDLSISVKRGNSIRITEPGESRVLTSAAIRILTINSAEIKQVDHSQIPQNAVYIEEGDVVVNAVGTYLGNAAIVDETIVGLPINHHVIVIRPDKRAIDPEYLALAFNSQFVQSKFQLGGVIPSLNLTQVSSALIPVPPISLQKELVTTYKNIQIELNEAIKKTEILRNRFEVFVSTLGMGGSK